MNTFKKTLLRHGLAINLLCIPFMLPAWAQSNLVSVDTTDGVFCGKHVSDYGNTIHYVDVIGIKSVGTSGNDIIIGTTGDDEIEGDAGDDCIFGMSGDDVIFGQEGNDFLDGGSGDDVLRGGRDDDELRGSRGEDKLRGGRGADKCDFKTEDKYSRTCDISHEATYPVVVSAGDLACNPLNTTDATVKSLFNKGYSTTSSNCRQGFISAIALGTDPAAFLAAGDYQYFRVDQEKSWALSYDASWGRLYHRTFPTWGDHENGASLFNVYFKDRFEGENGIDSVVVNFDGEAPIGGTYSFDLDNWHIVAIYKTSPEWLENDLKQTNANCILAYTHFPISSSGNNGDNDIYVREKNGRLWEILDKYGVTLVVSGDDHNYERFQPQTALFDDALTKPDEPWKTKVSPTGVVQFVVGTGGANTNDPADDHPNTAVDDNGQRVFSSSHLGFLKLTLKEDEVDFQFVAQNPTPATNSTMLPLEGYVVDEDETDPEVGERHLPVGVEIVDDGTIACS